MNALREIYDFITGGSLVSPIGLALAIGVAVAGAGLPPSMRVAIFTIIIVTTFVAASFERVR